MIDGKIKCDLGEAGRRGWNEDGKEKMGNEFLNIYQKF